MNQGSRRKVFTLIELLVVTGVIAVLASNTDWLWLVDAARTGLNQPSH